jgi:hypothetical protein
MTHDKAVVEQAVQVAQRWILAALRHRKLFSLAVANQSIRELLHRLNHRPFRKRDGIRASVFEALDKPAQQSLPTERFEISEWARARVNIDYHVAFDGNFYSVPHNLVQQLVEIRATVTTIEILHQSVRVASHVRSRGRARSIGGSGLIRRARAATTCAWQDGCEVKSLWRVGVPARSFHQLSSAFSRLPKWARGYLHHVDTFVGAEEVQEIFYLRTRTGRS